MNNVYAAIGMSHSSIISVHQFEICYVFSYKRCRLFVVGFAI